VRALVTGAGGFVGAHLVARLVADGWDVTCTVRPGGSQARITDLGVRGAVDVVEADLSDRGATDAAGRAARVDVAFLLAAAVTANILANMLSEGEETAPWMGIALWAGIIVTSLVAKPDWSVIRPAAKGAMFLAALVVAASLMPVKGLPEPSWQSAFGLGLLSSLFDNIPLTVLALKQGGYDWALLAYAVGVGGSMVWFGTSAGVALTNEFPEGRSLVKWLKQGWFVPVSFVVGFFIMLLLLGWNPAPSPVAGAH